VIIPDLPQELRPDPERGSFRLAVSDHVAQQYHAIQFQLQEELRAPLQLPMKEDSDPMRGTVHQFRPLELQSFAAPASHNDHGAVGRSGFNAAFDLYCLHVNHSFDYRLTPVAPCKIWDFPK
jgi:hypothetical protein